MTDSADEQSLLQSVAIQNARSIHAARERAERELINAKEALRQSEERLRAVFNQAAVGIAVADLTGQFEQANHRFLEIVGYPFSDLRKLTFLDITHPEDLERTRTLTQRLLAGEVRDICYEKRYLRRDGSDVWSSTTVTLLKDAMGKPYRYVGVIEDISRRKAADKVLEARERELSLIYDHVSDVIFNIGVEAGGFHFLSVNPAFLRVTGLTAERVVGKRIEDVIPEPSRSLVLEHYAAAIAQQQTIRWEEANHFPAGRRVGLVSVTPIFDAAGTCTNLIGTVHDITERKRQEEDRARLAAVVESSEDAIITKTLEGIITSWNQGAQRIFGYQAQEIVGRPVTVLIPPDRLAEEAEILAKLKNGERIVHYETVRMRKDGTRLDIALTISPLRDSTGAVIGASKIARDITAAKRAAEALAQSEARLRAVVEATPECVQIVSPEGALIFMNPAGIAMIEAHSPESVQGACVYDLIAPEHRSDWVARHTLICAGQSMSWQFEIIGLGGSRRWMETHAVPLPMADGRTGQLAVTREISAQKAAEAEREQLLNSERAARAEAERASLTKDEFLATLSHELRTPLNAILGWAQILRARDYAEEELNEGLSVIERNTRMQAQLIDDLLDMSRIISGKLRLDVQSVDVQDVLKAAVAAVRHSADAKGIRLEVVLDAYAGPVRGDPARLQQCFWNLISNAIKFTPRGGKVQVGLERVNSHLEVCVVDTGEGIRPEFLPHVFERFRQADAATTRRHGGLGLGLSIVKQLVEMHGGKVRAKSAGENQGSTFCVELPLQVVHTPKNGMQREHPGNMVGGRPQVQLDRPSLDGITVLAVDDEADARLLIQRILEECGAKVLVASSAAEAMALLTSARPHVIISDIGMPKEDGYDFIRKVRALGSAQGGKTPAAALTAFARAEDRTRALRAGFQTHVAKPVEPAELMAVVASLALRL